MSNNKYLLVGRNLVSFGEGIAPDLRTDIINCLHYAQSLADKQYDRQSDWRSWIDCYMRVIQGSGSQLTEGINASPFTVKGVKDSRALSKKVIGDIESSHLKQLWLSSYDTLLNSSHAQTFFNSWFSSGRSETFQVVPCESDEKGGAIIAVCGLQMTTERFDFSFNIWDAFLSAFSKAWKILSGKMTVQSRGAAFRFTAQGYGPYREIILNYLVDQGRQQIIEL